MSSYNKEILIIEYDEKKFMITAGLQDEELNFKIIETEIIPTNNIKDGKIINLESSINDLKKGLSLIEKKTNIIFSEASVITNHNNFDCINISGFKKINGNQVLEDDISFILNDIKAKISNSEKSKTIVHLFNTKFILDKNATKNLPIGLYGDFYSHQLTFFLMENDEIKKIKKLLNKSNLNLERLILKSFTEGIELVDKSNNGSFIKIFLGSNRSNLTFFNNSAYSYFENFNFGTDIIYKDISKVCSLNLSSVKHIFKEINFEKVENKSDYFIDKKYFDTNFKKISLDHINKVSASRIEELIEIIFNRNINIKNLDIDELPIYLVIEDDNILSSFGSIFKKFFNKKKESVLVKQDNLDKATSIQSFGELLSRGWSSEAIPIAQKKTSVISRFFSLFFD